METANTASTSDSERISDSDATSSSESEQETSETAESKNDSWKDVEVNFNERYVMSNSKNVGQAVIFSNEHFENRIPCLENRGGTEEDVKAIVVVLKKLGFEIDGEKDIYKDTTDIKAIRKLRKISKRNFDDYNCFLAVFLSHGDTGKLLMTEREINIQGHILDQFRGDNCKSLSGKPKIFLFQACRGVHSEQPVRSSVQKDTKLYFEKKPQSKPRAKQSIENKIKESLDNVLIPSGADFLLCYSSAEGYASYRYRMIPENQKQKTNNKELVGSLFIQTFVIVIEKYIDALKKGKAEEQDFVSLMTVVNQTMASYLLDDEYQDLMQPLSSIASTLRKKIYFPNLAETRVSQAKSDTTPEEKGDTGKRHLPKPFMDEVPKKNQEEPINN